MKALKLGMVGGGQGAFIGGVHRMAARLDGRWELVAGALSSHPARAEDSAKELGLDPKRSYQSYAEMAVQEAARADGIDAVAIVTPNHMHAGPAIAFLEAGIHVICDKPLAATSEQAQLFDAAVRASKAHFILTHNYTGYPVIRQARKLVENGELGEIRVIQAEYAQDWLSEAADNKQADWRVNPEKSGAGAIGDIGTHALNLASFVSGLQPQALCADLHSFGMAVVWMTMPILCCGLRRVRKVCFGPVKLRLGAKIRLHYGFMARKPVWNGSKKTQTN